MSYSRWSTSIWYTFWTSMSESSEFKWPTTRLKENQFFEICDLVSSYHISYGELSKLGVDGVIEEVRNFYSNSHKVRILGEEEMFKKEYTDEEFDELKIYLLEFMRDVDEHFKWKNFFRYEWYYPVRNWVYRKIRALSA